MACKIITAVAGAFLLGSATIASAHAPVFPQLSHAYRHFRHSPRLPYYGYHGHVPIFPPAIASGYAPLGVTAEKSSLRRGPSCQSTLPADSGSQYLVTIG